MDLNSVSEFLELVKNPSKYDKALKTLRDEQERLNAAIETVGKASDLDKLIKSNQALEHNIKSTYQSKEVELVGKVNTELAKAKTKQDQAKALNDKAQAALNAAEVETQHNRAIASINADLEAALRSKQQELDAREKSLDVKLAEYNEKYNKLKAALG